MAVDLPGVGLGRGAVDDGDRAAPDDLHDVVRADDAGGVLVDAEPEQARVLGDEAEQPPEPVPLLEVLVDDHARAARRGRPRSGPSGAWASPRDAPNAIMWLRHRRGAGGRAGDDRAVPEALEDRVGQARPADRRRQPQLVAAGQEDAGRVADRERRASRRWPAAGSSRGAAGPCATPSSLKTAPVALAGLEPERRGGADDGDRRVRAAGERDEAAQDDPVADLVLRAADDDDGSVGHGRWRSLIALRQRIADGRRARDAGDASRPDVAGAAGRAPTCENAPAMADAPPPQLRPVRGQRAGRGRIVVDLSDVVDRGTRRRAGVFRRALRREVSRLRDRRRILAIVLLSLTFALLLSGMIARGEAGGADARAYWAGVRIWLNGGDPYHPTGPFLPYVYAPWMLPLFTPWAPLPWDVAWFVWRVGTILLLLWTIDWAYRRRPLTTALIVALLGFPFGANLDTGNINLQLTLMLWAAQFTGPRLGGLLWALATWMKWVPAVHLARPRAAERGLGAGLARRCRSCSAS